MAQQSSYPVSSHYRPQVPQTGPSAPSQAAGQGNAHRSSQRSYPGQQTQRSAHPWSEGQAGPQPYGTAPTRMSGRAIYGQAGRHQPRQVLVAGGSVLALAALLITPNLNQETAQEVEPFTCLRQEQPQALVSRDQVKKLLETDLQASKATVQEFLKAPYCVLSPGKTEAGLPADREAYPLEFDPQTWLVVLYDGDRYVGYDFRFR
ncbi:hypothetical protein [Leptolyngbya sp. KIOST-1]|uniref:hypothetical protein n=1 Tax=Leptolyngbya sp. KIOST-1 TaxID=1229172 RepID=UPI0012E0A876|nr:hypothetical protein [Leptolyngbya sp. KIOST-1]